MYLDLCAIKYVYLLLSSLVLASCSGSKVDNHNKVGLKNGNDGKASFNDLNYDMIRLIATFMKPKEIVNWRYVNCLTLSSLPLKKLVEQTFNIFGLESVADNEPELAGVMRFAHISHDPFFFFKALMNDVVEGKKHYNALFIPLILHLFQNSFPRLGLQNKNEYEEQYFKSKFNNNVESYTILFRTFSGLGFHEKQKCQHSLERLFNSYVRNYIINSGLMEDNYGILRYSYTVLTRAALEDASSKGHTAIVELLLQSPTDIYDEASACALRHACINGHTSIVELLLQSHKDIHNGYVGDALVKASTKGHATIVELLLQSRKDIRSYHVREALKGAVTNLLYIIALISLLIVLARLLNTHPKRDSLPSSNLFFRTAKISLLGILARFFATHPKRDTLRSSNLLSIIASIFLLDILTRLLKMHPKRDILLSLNLLSIVVRISVLMILTGIFATQPKSDTLPSSNFFSRGALISLLIMLARLL
jgi:hypothetical protein